MKEFWAKNSGLIITIAIILIIIGIIYYVGKHAGRKYKPNDIIIPPDTQAPGTPGIYNPGPVTDAIFQDLDEVFGVHDAEPYQAAMKLSNSQLAAVYNDWNQRYSEKFDHKTIIQALKGDYSILHAVTYGAAYDWNELVRNLTARFESLPGVQGRIQQ